MAAPKKNYNKISTEKAAPATETVEVVSEAPEAVVENKKKPKITKKGVVCNCKKLNVRKEPKPDADIVGTVDSGTVVVIQDEVGEFYKIGKPDSEEFCMKKYISIKE